jgi:hypothetical protein
MRRRLVFVLVAEARGAPDQEQLQEVLTSSMDEIRSTRASKKSHIVMFARVAMFLKASTTKPTQTSVVSPGYLYPSNRL